MAILPISSQRIQRPSLIKQERYIGYLNRVVVNKRLHDGGSSSVTALADSS